MEIEFKTESAYNGGRFEEQELTVDDPDMVSEEEREESGCHRSCYCFEGRWVAALIREYYNMKLKKIDHLIEPEHCMS